MARRRRAWGLAALVCLLPTAAVLAHVRLVNPSNGNNLFWSNPANLGIVINSAGSDDIADGSHETSLRMAIDAWNGADGTMATLVEDTSASSQARTDWDSSTIHLILFDELNASGYFPGGSGVVAVTPVFFFSGGRIDDADVLFNGSGFQFTTSAEGGRFDVQDVATHELGHLLGLDHSPWAGATMYPYVDPSVILHRSLSEDEVKGMRAAYPDGNFGSLTGSVERAADDSPVAGAHVVARDASGRTAASILTDTGGDFTLLGLDPGTYTVYAVPLGDMSGSGSDAPVDAGNLGSGHTIETDFEPAIFGSQAVITGSETVAMGTLSVGADVSLNLGREIDRFPVTVIAGQSVTVSLRGSGLFNTATLTASDPDLILGTPSWFGTQVTFQVTVPASEPRGHVDLMVSDLGRISILPAALEVTPPAPSVASVLPVLGTASGGDMLAITGTGFQPGARIVIGDQIYTDGVGSTVVVDPTTINLTTNPTLVGMHDVVVYDPSGLEGRLAAGFETADIPTLDAVFPTAGVSTGGTQVTLSGQNFQAGLAVRIAGIDQGAVTYGGLTQVSFTTALGAPGGPYLVELENPDGGLATMAAYVYTTLPDPLLASVTPDSGKTGGGETVTFTGSNFTPTTSVAFDVDPATGSGGTAAASVTFVDANTLQVVTPQHQKGTVAVMVSDASGQATVLPGAFSFNGSKGGGGGCYTRALEGPRGGSRAILAGGWWLALVLSWLVLRRRPVATA